MANANVYQNIMATHTLTVDQSAFSVRIVITPKHACKENVLIHVLEPVDKTQYAEWLIISQCAVVIVDSLEMLLFYAIHLEVNTSS